MTERNHAELVAAQSQSRSATSALAASWRRSMLKHGLDPADRRRPDRLSDSELADRHQAMQAFLHVAGPQLDQLYNLVGLSGCNVLLTDPHGIVLDQRVSDADAQQFRDWGLWQGADWSEAAQGTNGIGTCLVEGRALTIHRDEHFHTRNTAMSCMDAPIWGPDGRLLAALDVSSARADQTERYNRLISAQVAQTARAIESLFFRMSLPRRAHRRGLGRSGRYRRCCWRWTRTTWPSAPPAPPVASWGWSARVRSARARPPTCWAVRTT